MAEFAFRRVTPVREALPGPRSWAIFRRTLGPKPEVKFFLSNAPTPCPRQAFVRVSGLRWPVETALEEARGEAGMDHYETRTWDGWHHHMTLAMLDHLFLVRLPRVFQKKSRVDQRASPPTHRARPRRPTGEVARHRGDSRLSPTTQSRRLLFSSQADTFTTPPTPVKAAKTQSFVVITEVS